jgi:hypothetical protein
MRSPIYYDSVIWKSKLGLETELGKDQGIDLKILQYDESGEMNIFSAYSNPGFIFFGRILEYSKAINKTPSRKNIFKNKTGGNLFSSNNNKSFKQPLFLFNHFLKEPLIYNKTTRQSNEVYCGSFPEIIFGKISGKEFQMREKRDDLPANFRFHPSDIKKLLPAIYQQFPHEYFQMLYDMIIEQKPFEEIRTSSSP